MQHATVLPLAFAVALGLLVPTLATAQGVSCLDAPDGSPLDVVCVDNDGNVLIDAGATQDLTQIDTGIFVEGGNGDVNSSGLPVNFADVSIVISHLSGTTLLTPAQYAIADVNGDGRVSWDEVGLLVLLFQGTPKNVAVQQIESGYGMISPTVFYVRDGASVGIGTSNPSATLDVNGSLHVNGPITQRTTTLHPDYVFEPDYDLESIAEHTAFMLREKHLEAVPAAAPAEDGSEVLDLGGLQLGMLEELEKAHLYIAELNRRLEAQTEKIAALEAAVEALSR